MLILQADRDSLLKPLQAVTGIVERRHTLPILSNILLESKDGQTKLWPLWITNFIYFALVGEIFSRGGFLIN